MTRDRAIAEITRRLVDYYRPERVYLFGSVARGDDNFDSDLDFLVVVPDDTDADKFRGLDRPLADLEVGADVIPWRKSDFDARATHVKASLPATVVREGRLLYDARPISV